MEHLTLNVPTYLRAQSYRDYADYAILSWRTLSLLIDFTGRVASGELFWR